MTTFKKAQKIGIRLRAGACGPTGSGKTMWGLKIGTNMAQHFGGRLAVVDSEHGSAKKYGDKYDFDVLELASFGPEKYIDALATAERAGYNVVLIDSISHAWAGKDGVLDKVDAVEKAGKSKNKWAAWREGSKLQNDLVEAMLSYPGHVIVTMRTKMEYEQVINDDGKKEIRKVGLQPIQRDGLEYEFDIVFDINAEHELLPSKTRCPEIDGKVFRKHEADKFCATVITWLGDQATVEDKASADVAKADDKQAIINRVVSGEKMVYHVERAWLAARCKYLPSPVLNDSTIEELTAYLNHMIEKAKAKKEAGNAPQE